jgi:ComF family protein
LEQFLHFIFAYFFINNRVVFKKKEWNVMKIALLKEIRLIADYILPRLCVGCSIKLKLNEEIFCSFCENKLLETEEEDLHKFFLRNFLKYNCIDYFISAFDFEKDNPIQKGLHSLKYEGKFKIGEYFGKKIATRFKNDIENYNINCIIPVPLHPAKKAERGYNQSYYIAKGISDNLVLPIYVNVLKRKQHTSTQTFLSANQRKENIKGAFAVSKKEIIANRNILLVDDVCTTGSTLIECSQILKQNGAAKIVVASVAIAI